MASIAPNFQHEAPSSRSKPLHDSQALAGAIKNGCLVALATQFKAQDDAAASMAAIHAALANHGISTAKTP